MGVYQAGSGAYGPLISTVRECHPAFVMIADEYKAVQDTKTTSPETLVGFRFTGHDFEIGGAKAQQLLPVLHNAAPSADMYSIANEILPYDGAAAIAAVCTGYIEAARVASGLNLVITGGNTNTGFPALTAGNLEAMTPMLQLYAEYHFPVAVHIYNNGIPSANDVAILKALVARAPGLKIVIEEYGLLDNRMVSGAAFEEFLRLDDFLDDSVIGVAIFALSSVAQWRGCDFTNDLPRLIKHVKMWK